MIKNQAVHIMELNNGFLMTVSDPVKGAEYWVYGDNPAGWSALFRKLFRLWLFDRKTQNEIVQNLLVSPEPVTGKPDESAVPGENPLLAEEIA